MKYIFNIIEWISNINTTSISVGFIGLILLITTITVDRMGYIHPNIPVGQGVSKKTEPVLFKRLQRRTYLFSLGLIIFATLLELIFN